MHRFLMTAALLGMFAVGSVATAAGVAAHEGTPHAAQGGTPAGEPVSYVNDQGDEVAQITVDEVVDPFDEYDEGYEPERGTRYVAVRVTFEATGEEPVPVALSNVSLLDSQGFWISPTNIARTAEQESADPLLEDTELAPGDSVTGLVIFAAFEENDVDQVLWQPAGDRLISLASAS